MMIAQAIAHPTDDDVLESLRALDRELAEFVGDHDPEPTQQSQRVLSDQADAILAKHASGQHRIGPPRRG